MHHNYRILFEKPNLAELTCAYTVADMHFHSHCSDGTNSPAEIAERALELGIGVAITDHNEIAAAVELDRDQRILSIPGIEITSGEGTHLLAYFYDAATLQKFFKRELRPFLGPGVMSSTALSMEEIIARGRAYPCLLIFPHPYCAGYTGIYNLQFSADRLDRIFAEIDGVEAINAGNLKKWNLKCAILGFNLAKAITAGSDGHTLSHMGRAVTYAHCKPTRKALLERIRRQQNQVIGKEMDILRKVTSNGLRLRSNLRNSPDLMGKNIRYGRTVINSKSKTWRDSVYAALVNRFQ